MKRLNAFVILMCLLTIGCKKDEINSSLEGFNIVVNDSVVVSHNDIDFYDFSTHTIYLKNECLFFNDVHHRDTFYVYANGSKIYSGNFGYTSGIGNGPEISGSMYENSTIRIGFVHVVDQNGNLLIKDLRGNPRIAIALNVFGQFHPGLECKINAITFTSPTNVTFEFEIKNNDSFNYYIFDPNKMGIQLFHFFTNGLHIFDYINHKGYNANVVSIHPDPWDSWKMEWLSLIKSKETKKFTIYYTNFDSVPTGNYKADFYFPGLIYGVHKEDLQQDNGRLWPGFLMPEINLTIK